MRTIVFTFVILISISGCGQSISQLYENTNEAVVLIKTSKPEIMGQGFPKLLVNVNGIGSGFVISEDGEIMTASHVVQTAENIMVKFSDGEEIFAKVLYSYPSADVALIKLLSPKSTPLKTVKLSNSDEVKIGDQIFVIGAPFGLGHSLTVGYVSGKYIRKHIESGFVSTDFLQTDAAINKGSSGAPMFNMKGEVIGISSFILSNSEGFQGLGFAATSNIAYKLLCEYKAIWTGIESYLLPDYLAEIFNLPQKSGLLIQRVASLSLGYYLGLKGGEYKMSIEGEELLVGGDILLSLEDIFLINEDSLHKSWLLMQQLKSGDSLKIKILRKGKILEITRIIP
jgi:serine protease Do